MTFRPVVCAALLSLVLSSPASAVQHHYGSLKLTAAWHERPRIYATDFPLDFRSVPRHPDDWYLTDVPFANDPLPAREVSTTYPNNFQLAFTYHPAPVVGVGMVLITTSSENTNFYWARYIQNQYGTSEEGVGMSMRYYEMKVDNRAQYGLYGVVALPWIHLSKRLLTRVAANGVYDLKGLDITAESGWHRYASPTAWKWVRLGTVYEHALQVQGEFGRICGAPGDQVVVFLFAQINYPRSEFRRTGAGGIAVRLDDRPYWALGIGIGE